VDVPGFIIFIQRGPEVYAGNGGTQWLIYQIWTTGVEIWIGVLIWANGL
jgi:hypothetical protein